MGLYNQGIHGEFKGRVGNIIGSSWKGKSVMKIRPASVGNPRTILQQTNRGRFALMGRFLSGFNRLVRIGWRPMVENTTAFNEAMRYNLAAAISGEFPAFEVDYSKVRLSVGQLPVPANLQVLPTSSLSLSMTWEDNSYQELAKGSDLFMVGIYHEESGESYCVTGACTRQDLIREIVLPDNWKNREVNVFLFLVSTLGIGSLNSIDYISPTVFAGTVMLADQ